MENQAIAIVILIVIGFFGLVATIIFYFARYFLHPPEEQEQLARKEPAEPAQPTEPAELTKPAAPTPVPLEAEPSPVVLTQALQNTRASLLGRIKNALVSPKGLSSEDLEQLEEILYTSDLGPQTVQRLIAAVEERLPGKERSDFERVCEVLKAEMIDIFSHVEVNGAKDLVALLPQVVPAGRPQVWMIVGVNGAGKTTTIGKLAFRAAQLGLKTLVVAGDTFRAAAGDQLKVWTDRAQVEIFSPEGIKDPSAVAFDGLQMAKARAFDLVIVDTAGRLHTQVNLMEELKKMKRVMSKVLPEAPHEVIIVLDANSGQNALVQAKTFHDSLHLTGAVLTKLDGSAKGGVAVGLACELQLPIRLIGVGEGLEDLRPFQSKEFVDSIL